MRHVHRDMIEALKLQELLINIFARYFWRIDCMDRKWKKKVDVQIIWEKLDYIYFRFINILINLYRLNSVWVKFISVKKKLM